MKYLIINADDFGWSEKVNEGIIEAHHNGILTSATLFANAPATNHAIELTKSTPKLSVGVHLCYSPWPPLLPAKQLGKIFTSQGKPKFSNAKLWIKTFFHSEVTVMPHLGPFSTPSTPSCHPELVSGSHTNEMLKQVQHDSKRHTKKSEKLQVTSQLYLHFHSQIQSLLNKGVSISHLDTHKHLHFWPSVFKIVLKLAEEFKIPAIRFINPSIIERGPLNLKMRAVVLALSLPQRMNRTKIRHSSISFADNFIGIPQTGHWTKQMFLDNLNGLKSGVTEIMMHPGYPDGLENEPTRLVQSRQAELKILTDREVKEFFSKCQNIKLIGYRDLPRINRER